MAGAKIVLQTSAGQKSPAALAAAGRKPPRDIMWAKIRELKTGFTLEQVAAPARLDLTSARHFMNTLVAAGLVQSTPGERTPRGRLGPAIFTLVRDPGIVTPRFDLDGQPVTQGGTRAAAWRAMRALKSFTIRDLHVTSGITEVDAKSYCKYLLKAGYIAFKQKGAGKGAGATVSVYRFVESRFTGPQAPQVTRIKVVFDPNIGRAVWPLADQVEGQDA